MSTPIEFHPTANPFGIVMLRFAPLLALFLLIASTLGSLAFGGRLVPGITVGVIATIGLVVYVGVRFRKMVNNTVVRFSPAGVELIDATGIHVRLAWGNITKIGLVSTAVAEPKEIKAGDLEITVKPMRNLGLIGWGERYIPPTAPDLVKQQAAKARINPQTGYIEVGIPLSVIDKTWTAGQIGQIVRTYRPDLLPA